MSAGESVARCGIAVGEPDLLFLPGPPVGRALPSQGTPSAHKSQGDPLIQYSSIKHWFPPQTDPCQRQVIRIKKASTGSLIPVVPMMQAAQAWE